MFRAPSTYANTPNVASVATDIVASPNFGLYTVAAGYYVFRADARPGNSYADGLQGYGAGGASGVHGFGGANGAGVTGEGYGGLAGYGTDGEGVYGQATNGSGVLGSSTNGVGGVFTGGRAAIRLNPKSGAGAPTTGTHARGDLVVDNAGVLFLCKASGTPGTWVQVSETAGSGTPGPTPAGPSFHILPTPDRFVDTRINLGGVQGPVPAGTTSTYQMTGRNGQSGNASLQIPGTATALVGNLTVIGGPSVPVGSYVTLWPQGDQPTTSSINFGPGAVVANSYTAGLAAGGTISAFAQQQCDYIIDVVGYYG